MKKEDVTLEMVEMSEFGCKHCLFSGCECNDHSRFEPSLAYDGQASCRAYVYCD
uniref:Uncharacterized protein n=1 Tax=viral metagenome TaxID=1070528 RepID=A0A6M3LKL1_9ZZZZ